MLVIPDRMRSYFLEVEQWALEQRIKDRFDEAMLRLHLYGCDWSSPENARVTLYSKDFAPKSFLYSIEFKRGDKYEQFISGGLIFNGTLDEKGNITPETRRGAEWRMHS